MNKTILLLGLAVFPLGCTMAPKYARPAAPVPAEWPDAVAAAKTTNAPAAADLRWREFFTDENLKQVISLALTNNRDLRLAALNAEHAQALYGVARAELLPAINGNGNMSRQRSPAAISPTGKTMTYSQYEANLGVASWEIDFFGRIRSLKEEALQNYFASEQARRAAQISLISSVAQAYLALAADRENLQLSEDTLAAQQTSYRLVQRRHDLGLATDLDLYQAQAPVDTARRNAAQYQQQVAQDENALNLLAGVQVTNRLLPATLSQINPPAEIAAGLPSEVLLSRPDILQAEDQLKAANADIGAARAAFFPRVSLTAAFGTASSDLSGLFKSGSQAWNYAPQIVMPIFDARTWSASRAAKVQREIAVAEYEKAIQSAFREVADALAVRANVDAQLAAQQSLTRAYAESYRLANSRYEKGIDNFLNVLDAQRSLFAAQQGEVLLRFAKLANQANLYAVLGGGGQDESATNAPALAAASPRANKK